VSLEDEAMPYFPADVEQQEAIRVNQEAAERARREAPARNVKYHLAASGGRRGCPHPAHRMATVEKSPASLVLPECAGREAWLQARRDGIGGSEVGALIGVSNYETSWSVWNAKKREPKDISGQAAIEWGHRLEGVVAEKTAEDIGLVSRFAGGLWADRAKPFLRVTPDRFATRPRAWKALGVIECKTAGDDTEWESGNITATGQGSGRAPLSYQCQVQWQLGILGLKKGWLGCFVLGTERSFFTVEIDFNPEWYAEMAAAAETFYVENVLADEPPMHDLRHPKTEAMLKELHPHVVQQSVDLDEGASEWLEDYAEAKARFADAEKNLKAIQNYFRMELGDAGAGYLGEKKVASYPEINTSRVDIEALKRDYPEIAEKVTVRSTYRRLTISPPKK
jgi:putative phage-type endonuclease